MTVFLLSICALVPDASKREVPAETKSAPNNNHNHVSMSCLLGGEGYGERVCSQSVFLFCPCLYLKRANTREALQ